MEQKQDKMAVAKRDVKFVQTNVPRWLNGNLLLEHKSEITNPNPWLVCNKVNLKPVKKPPKLCVAQKVVVKPTSLSERYHLKLLTTYSVLHTHWEEGFFSYDSEEVELF